MKRIALYKDSLQMWKCHEILKAQLSLTDIPYQLGTNAYGSNPMCELTPKSWTNLL